MIKTTKFKEATHYVGVVFEGKTPLVWYTDNETSSKHIFYKITQTKENVTVGDEQWFLNRDLIRECYTGPINVG